MGVSTVLPIVISVVSAAIAIIAVWQSWRLQNRQWRRDEIEIRRDVLRRFFAYRYRLTDSLRGTDGEPFIALHEAWIVFAGFPEMTAALAKLHNDLGKSGMLARNVTALIRAMATAANISTQQTVSQRQHVLNLVTHSWVRPRLSPGPPARPALR